MAQAETNAPKGILLVTGAVLLFAVSDVVTKHLAASYPVVLVTFWRYFVNVALLALILWPSQRAVLWRTQRSWLVLIRALCLCAGSLTMGLALKVMPVGETVGIVYLAPFLVMLLSAPLLGEKVNLVGWIGAMLGFTGVLMIARPGSGLDPVGVGFCLINACCAAAYHLLTRFLARTETTWALLFHTAAVGTVVFGILSLGSLDIPLPTPLDLGLMALLGVLATAGHFLFTAAYRIAPAALLAPVNYLHLAWAGGLGWLVFGHVPDHWSIAGMALVMLAGGLIALRSMALARRARLAAEPAA